MTARFQKIDDQNRGAHYHLTAEDECYFWREYTSGKDYSFSETNSLISNLKKKPSLRLTNQWQYKTRAIRECAVAFGQAISAAWLSGATLVPVPPSKMRGDPEYDERMLQVCRIIPAAKPVDVREVVIQTQSLPAAHEGQRPSVEDLLAVYQIDQTQLQPRPNRIGIVDDVLTAGTHFRAMHTVLHQQFPDVSIVGFFIARRVFPDASDDFSDDL